MNEVREVHHYDETSTNSTWLAVLVIAIVVAAGTMIAMWQPWAGPTRNETTIIRDSPAPAPTVINPPAASAPPVIVTPPAQSPDINIRTETKTNPGTGTTGSTNEESSATTGD